MCSVARNIDSAKNAFYEVCIRPAMLCNYEIWSLTQHLEDQLCFTEMRMLRYIYGITLQEHRTNKAIREQVGIEALNKYSDEKTKAPMVRPCMLKGGGGGDQTGHKKGHKHQS